MSGSLLNALANPATVNPLDNYRKALDVNQGINENALFQARRAAGQAALDSIDPTTGLPDQAKTNLGIQAAGPLAAPYAQQAMQQNQTLSSEQYSQQMKRLAYGSAGFMQILLDNNGTAPLSAIKQYYDRGVADKVVTQAEEDKIMSGFGADPAANATIGRQRVMQSVQGQEALSRANGTPFTATGAGGVMVGGTASSQTGALKLPPQPGVQTGLSPQDLAREVDGPPDGQGNPTKITLGAMLERQGANIPGMPTYKPTGAAPPSPLGTGRPVPPALRGPNAPPDAPPPASAGGSAVVSGQSPAQTAAQTATGGTSAKAFQDISDQGVQSQSRGAVLGNMLADTTQFTTGPLADRIEKARALAQRLGFNIDTSKLTANESFNKLAAQLSTSQGSDARLAVSQNANPHADLSPGGVDLMLRQLSGNEDYLQARKQVAATYPNTADIRGFESSIGAKLDPRAFQFNRMTPAQRVTYADSLSPADRAKVQSAYNYAHGAGLFGGQ